MFLLYSSALGCIQLKINAQILGKCDDRNHLPSHYETDSYDEMDPSIIFENENFVAVDKPGNWLSVPSRLGKNDNRPCIGLWLKEKYKSQIYPLHRLDYEVSGILLFARTADAHRTGQSAFESHEVIKTYEAWTEGVVAGNWKIGQEFIWKSQILRGKKRSFFSPHGKPAETLAIYMGNLATEGEGTIKWKLQPRTGRSHQLRLELSSRKFPILGDKLYGAKKEYPNGIALRAVRLEFKAKSLLALSLPDQIKVQNF